MLDRDAVRRMLAATSSAATAGAIAGVVVAAMRGRSARHVPEYAMGMCVNFGLFGCAYAGAVETLARAGDGGRGWRERTLAGGLVGGAGAWAHGGRGRAATGAALGAAAAAAASAETATTVGERGERFAFPSWSPIQYASEDDEVDERELFERMERATRGELSAEDEARTRDEYSTWRMRRAERSRGG